MARTFEELIGRFLDDLYSAALCFTMDEYEAEELLQESSIRAFHQLHRSRRSGDFRQVMLEILVSTYLLRSRRAGRDPLTEEGPSLEELLSTGASADLTPFPERGTPGYRMLEAWMAEVWSELSEGDRLILWLADVERVRHSRLAELVGLPETQVRARHYRARSTLSREVARQLRRHRARGSGS